MTFSKLLATVVYASTLIAALVLEQKDSIFPIKRSDGIVFGVDSGTSYYWSSKGMSEQCLSLLPSHYLDSLDSMGEIWPKQYDDAPASNNIFWGLTIYPGYLEGIYATSIDYESVTPNTTATWINKGADIENMWYAMRNHTYGLWSQNATFQSILYDVNKTVGGVSNYAGQFSIRVKSATFLRNCDMTCGGTCNPYKCDCKVKA